jgi:hypothetical protein
MIEYKLKNPIPIYNKETGDYVGAETVVVEFKGKKGLVSLLRMREEVYSIIRESSKGQSPSPDNENESAAPTGKMKVSDLVPMIAMSKGSASLFSTVMEQLHYFAKANGELLKESYQDEMSNDDLQGLYAEVLKSFLLSDVCRQVNSLNK